MQLTASECNLSFLIFFKMDSCGTLYKNYSARKTALKRWKDEDVYEKNEEI